MPDPGNALARLWVSLGPGCVARGAAIHLGGDRFLTAAHLVDGSLSPPGCRGPMRAALVFRGQEMRARTSRQGQSEDDPALGLRYLAGRDLALLRTEAWPRPDPPGMPAAGPDAASVLPCPEPAAAPDEEAGDAPRPEDLGNVLVVTPRRRTVARLLPPIHEAGTGYGSYDEIDLRLEPGESGGAVFEAASGCLLGLVSHREEGTPRTRLVPAVAIRAFLGE